MSLMTATEKLFGTTTLDERQAAVAKRTYALLSLSVLGAAVGGSLGATNESLALFFALGPPRRRTHFLALLDGRATAFGGINASGDNLTFANNHYTVTDLLGF